jgi:hypothetical protein
VLLVAFSSSVSGVDSDLPTNLSFIPSLVHDDNSGIVPVMQAAAVTASLQLPSMSKNRDGSTGPVKWTNSSLALFG